MSNIYWQKSMEHKLSPNIATSEEKKKLNASSEVKIPTSSSVSATTPTLEQKQRNSETSSSTTSLQDKKRSASHWNHCIRLDHRVPIEPTHCENLYYCPFYNNRLNNKIPSSETPATRNVRSSPSVSNLSSETVSYYCNITVNLKNTDFYDSDAIELIRQLEERIFGSNQQDNSEKVSDTVYFVSLDISENHITCKGMKEIALWFTKNGNYVRLKHLKAYKNAISDMGVLAVADLILKQPSALDELHLSHNLITSEGAAAIFKSFSHARRTDKSPYAKRKQRYMYPRPADINRGTYLPVWIRLEYNYIYEAPLLLFKWEADCRALRYYNTNSKLICFADRPNIRRNGKDPHCSPARCLRATVNHSPLLHLYSYYHQSASQPVPPSLKSVSSSQEELVNTPSLLDNEEPAIEAEPEKEPYTTVPFTIQHKTVRTKRFTYTQQQNNVTYTMQQVNQKLIKNNKTTKKEEEPAVPKKEAEVDKKPVKTAEVLIATRKALIKPDNIPCKNVEKKIPEQPPLQSSQQAPQQQQTAPQAPQIAASPQQTTQHSKSEDRWDVDLPSLSNLLSEMCPPKISNDAYTENYYKTNQNKQKLLQRLDLIDSAVVGIGKSKNTDSGDMFNFENLNNADYQNLQSVLKQGGINDCLDYSTLIEHSSILTKPNNEMKDITTQNISTCIKKKGLTNSNALLPLYIFVDASAFAEMRRLTKFDHVNLFSFPGLLTLCENRVLCHSSMQPIICKTPSGDTEKYDANQSVILMIVNSVEDGLLQMTESQPFLRETLVELYQQFISHLAKLGVIESIDGLENQLKNEWMILNESICKKAELFGAPLDAVKIIDFAFVWAHHLAKVSQSDKASVDGKFPFALFITNHDRTKNFFQYLQETNLNSDMLNNLLCLSLDQFNSILREAYPNLIKLVQSNTTRLDAANQRYVDSQEILSAQHIRSLVHKFYLKNQQNNWPQTNYEQNREQDNYSINCQRSFYKLHRLLSKLIMLYESQPNFKILPSDFIQECKNECVNSEKYLNLKVSHPYQNPPPGLKSIVGNYQKSSDLQFDHNTQFSCYM